MRTYALTMTAFVMCVVFSGRPVHADTMKVSDIETICRTNNDNCRLLVFGLAQGLSLRETMADHKAPNGQYLERKAVLFCLPPDITMNAMMMAFKIKLAEDLAVFPNDRDLEGPGFASGILLHLFPCKQ